MMRKIIAMALILNCFVLNGQDELTRNDNIVNPWIINPAVAGSGRNSFNFYAARQWFGINDAPISFAFHIDGRLAQFDFYTNKMKINKTSYKSRGRVGLGAAVFTDRSGPFSFSELKVIYAFHLPFKGNNISFGLSNDLEMHSVNERIMNPDIDNDPSITGVNRSSINYNPGIGVQYYGDSFNAGISVNNLFGNSVKLKNDFISSGAASRIFSMHGSYKYEIQPGLFIEPAVVAGISEVKDVQIDLSGSVTYNDAYSMKITYRSAGTLFFHAGAHFDRYGFYYGYSTPFGAINRYTSGSHEITVSVRFGQYVF